MQLKLQIGPFHKLKHDNIITENIEKKSTQIHTNLTLFFFFGSEKKIRGAVHVFIKNISSMIIFND
jgi:hypothetical protein